MTEHPDSRALLARARAVDASIAARGGLLSPDLGDDGVPVFADRAAGPYVWSVDGRRYLDLVLGYGSVVLGHADPRVDEPVIDRIRRGVSPTMHTRTQVELAELLVSVVPGAEAALLLRTGSDATAAAVRLARAHTGRPRVVQWGYHGWHEWCAGRPAGLSPGAQDHLHRIGYGDLAELSALLDRHGDEVACVIMMPYEIDVPPPHYLPAVRELVHRHGGLFVLDEVRSGFRLALGGAQEHFGVRADLVSFSKAMANGYAISAVTGRREVMAQVGAISVSSVFFRSADGMAAATATIGAIRDGGVVPRLWALGRRLLDGIGAAAAASGVPAVPVGLPPTPYVWFDLPAAEVDAARRVFYRAVLDAGVLLHPSHHWFVCDTMSEPDVEAAVEAVRAGFDAVARATP